MGLRDIYPQGEGIAPLFEEATDTYLSDLPAVSTLMKPAEIASFSSKDAEKMIEQAASTVRRIEVLRRSLVRYANIAESLDGTPAMQNLPESLQTALKDLATRRVEVGEA